MIGTNQNPKTPNTVANQVKHNEMMNVHADAMQCNYGAKHLRCYTNTQSTRSGVRVPVAAQHTFFAKNRVTHDCVAA
jgi:hypothetical protein